jgi:hypothetical protein
MVADLVALAKQLHWLEIFIDSSKQAVAHAGKDAVAVFTIKVHVAQNCCPGRIPRLAHPFVTELTQPRARGMITLEMIRKRVVDVV